MQGKLQVGEFKPAGTLRWFELCPPISIPAKTNREIAVLLSTIMGTFALKGNLCGRKALIIVGIIQQEHGETLEQATCY